MFDLVAATLGARISSCGVWAWGGGVPGSFVDQERKGWHGPLWVGPSRPPWPLGTVA